MSRKGIEWMHVGLGVRKHTKKVQNVNLSLRNLNLGLKKVQNVKIAGWDGARWSTKKGMVGRVARVQDQTQHIIM